MPRRRTPPLGWPSTKRSLIVASSSIASPRTMTPVDLSSRASSRSSGSAIPGGNKTWAIFRGRWMLVVCCEADCGSVFQVAGVTSTHVYSIQPPRPGSNPGMLRGHKAQRAPTTEPARFNLFASGATSVRTSMTLSISAPSLEALHLHPMVSAKQAEANPKETAILNVLNWACGDYGTPCCPSGDTCGAGLTCSPPNYCLP